MKKFILGMMFLPFVMDAYQYSISYFPSSFSSVDLCIISMISDMLSKSCAKVCEIQTGVSAYACFQDEARSFHQNKKL